MEGVFPLNQHHPFFIGMIINDLYIGCNGILPIKNGAMVNSKHRLCTARMVAECLNLGVYTHNSDWNSHPLDSKKDLQFVGIQSLTLIIFDLPYLFFK